MPDLSHPYFAVKDLCTQYNATLVVVSKTRTIEEINVLYDFGQRIFAENRAQELIAKAPAMPADIEWHLIGHLQTNKVKAILPFVACIHSCDSERILEKINVEAGKAKKVIRCLLQVKVAKEESKFGWSTDALESYLQDGRHKALDHIRIAGIMGMTTLTDDEDIIRSELAALKQIFDHFKATYFAESKTFNTLSMGMSGDYIAALEEGSTMVRIGSLLFP